MADQLVTDRAALSSEGSYPNLMSTLLDEDFKDYRMENAADEEVQVTRTGSESSTSLVALPSKPQATEKKPRKRNRQAALPRVIKTDIRRHYGTMITNVFNSHDISLLQSFFATYCTGSMHFTLNPVGNVSPRLDDINEHLLTSATGLSLFVAVGTQLSPDETISLINTKVVTRSDREETVIVLTLRSTKTSLFAVSVDEVVNEMVATAFNLKISTVHTSAHGFAMAEETTYAQQGTMLSQEEKLRESLGDIVSIVANSPSPTHSDAVPIFNSNTSPEESGLVEVAHERPAFESMARIFTPAKYGATLRIPDAFAFYQATRGHTVPLQKNPQRLCKFSQVILTVNSLRQIDLIAAVPISDVTVDATAER